MWLGDCKSECYIFNKTKGGFKVLKNLQASISAKQKLQYFSKHEINCREGRMTVINP